MSVDTLDTLNLVADILIGLSLLSAWASSKKLAARVEAIERAIWPSRFKEEP